MNIRTDLAVERQQMTEDSEIEGVNVYSEENEDCRATVIEITTKEGEEALGKPKGKYITLEMEDFFQKKCRIAIDYGSWFGGEAESCIRINLATSRENVVECVSRIVRELKK